MSVSERDEVFLQEMGIAPLWRLRRPPQEEAVEAEPEAELAAEARGVSVDELDALHAVYGQNAFMSRLRSHPNVAEKYYAQHIAN